MFVRTDSGRSSPVLTLFGMAAAMAIAVACIVLTTPWNVTKVQRFAAVAMCLLAVQILRDVERFSTIFARSDLLAQCWVNDR